MYCHCYLSCPYSHDPLYSVWFNTRTLLIRKLMYNSTPFQLGVVPCLVLASRNSLDNHDSTNVLSTSVYRVSYTSKIIEEFHCLRQIRLLLR